MKRFGFSKLMLVLGLLSARVPSVCSKGKRDAVKRRVEKKGGRHQDLDTILVLPVRCEPTAGFEANQRGRVWNLKCAARSAFPFRILLSRRMGVLILSAKVRTPWGTRNKVHGS